LGSKVYLVRVRVRVRVRPRVRARVRVRVGVEGAPVERGHELGQVRLQPLA
jgi:hypothetical protein